LTSEQKRALVEPMNEILSIGDQCEALGLQRSTFYYEPAMESQENLLLMRVIDEIYLKHPFFGYRRMSVWLQNMGYNVNRKRILRLMKLMGIEAIYPKKSLSASKEGAKKYPYLLKDVVIEESNQVWSTDITYIPLKNGFLYLVAIIDWYSRYILSWELSNTLDEQFCLETLEKALKIATPKIFNSDQGVQFTGNKFTGILERFGIKISWDGRGRWLDNIFIERFWRSLKQEVIYINRYESGKEAAFGIANYFEFYNNKRPHQSLEDATPLQIYRKEKILTKGGC